MENNEVYQEKAIQLFKDMITRSEMRRLEKAILKKDKAAITDWIIRLETHIFDMYENEFESKINIIMLTVVYTLHFNEKTRFGNDRIDNFMQDLLTTIDMFRTGDATVQDYKDQLRAGGIIIDEPTSDEE